jgi:hypothetical protein
VNGKKQGQGVYTFSGGGRYEGEFSDDKPIGKGVRVYPDGTTKE